MMIGLQQATEAYFLEASNLSTTPLGEGHIHDTFLVRDDSGASTRKLVLQRINQSVFPDPRRLVRTSARITNHLRGKALASGRDPGRCVLRLIPNRDGKLSFEDSVDGVWRAFSMIEGAAPVACPEHPAQARAIGFAFGRFLRDLSDLPPNEIEVALPHLHDTEHHLRTLDDVVRRDPMRRLAGATDELASIDAHREAGRVWQANLPLRLIHADTKIDNVLLDATTGEGVCVIDLDTVMSAPAVLDIGNFLRSVLRRSRALSDGSLEPGIAFFEAGLRGYRSGVGDLLNESEWDAALDAVAETALLLAIRFLADFLTGDPYFRVATPGDNLRRCREQLAVAHWCGRHEIELRNRLGRAVLERG